MAVGSMVVIILVLLEITVNNKDMIKLDIKEDQFVFYESGRFYGIIKNVRKSEIGGSNDLTYDLLMLHNGEVTKDIESHSGLTTELEVVEKIDVETALVRDKGNAYEEIGKYFKQIAIITNIEDKIRQIPG